MERSGNMKHFSERRRKILVVDDEKDVIETLRMSLESDNYSVVEAYTGYQAIKKAQSEAPDLILLDVMLPDITGYETCNRLKKNPLTKLIPIIMLTGLSGITKSDKKLGLDLGADGYITKPIDLEELKARICAVLQCSN